MDEPKADIAYTFNPDPAWQAYILRYESIINKVVKKYCASDEALQEDCAQEARVALATVRPERVSGFQKSGQTDEVREAALDRYLRNVIRNAVLSYLDSYSKGNWYIGRTRSVRDARTGVSHRVYFPPRFSSLDKLVEEHGMQIDEHGTISWIVRNDDVPDFDGTSPKAKTHGDAPAFRWSPYGPTEEVEE